MVCPYTPVVRALAQRWQDQVCKPMNFFLLAKKPIFSYFAINNQVKTNLMVQEWSLLSHFSLKYDLLGLNVQSNSFLTYWHKSAQDIRNFFSFNQENIFIYLFCYSPLQNKFNDVTWNYVCILFIEIWFFETFKLQYVVYCWPKDDRIKCLNPWIFFIW